MNTMNIPGFTAEASIYKTGEDYQIAGIMAQFVADTSSILPARIAAEQCVCPCKILVCDTAGCRVEGC